MSAAYVYCDEATAAFTAITRETIDRAVAAGELAPAAAGLMAAAMAQAAAMAAAGGFTGAQFQGFALKAFAGARGLSIVEGKK